MLSLNPSIWEIWCPRRQQRLAFPPKNAFVHSCYGFVLFLTTSILGASWSFSQSVPLTKIHHLTEIHFCFEPNWKDTAQRSTDWRIISIAPKCFQVRMFQIDRFKYPIFQRPIERPSHTQPTSVLITREWAWEISQLAFDKPTENCSSFLRINVGYI